jgi:chromosome segregation ATPase
VSDSIVDDVSGGSFTAGDDFTTGVVFDTNSGISETEQKDILAGIEKAVRRDHHALSEIPRVRAKKKGILFPLLVNAAALAILGAGLVVVLMFRDAEETQDTGAAALYNSAERVLIREIRRDTALELESKEQEINSILAQLAGVDGELQELYSSNQELTVEQRAIESNLQHLQEEYRSSLGSLQDERSRILESSRVREASLRAQFDERAGELAAQAEQSREDLSRAREELERLSSDQERGAVIEAHLSAMYLSAAATINGGRLREAAATLDSMRNFINTPSFQGIHSVQPRRTFYLSSITTLEGLISLAERLNTALAFAEAGQGGAGYDEAIAQLEERNAALEEQVAGLNQAVIASGAEGSGLGRQVGELQDRISGLQGQAAGQERTLTEQRRMLEEQQRSNSELSRQVSDLTGRNTNLDRQVSDLTGRNTSLDRQVSELTGRTTDLGRQVSDLTGRNTDLDRQVSELTARNGELTQNITNLNRTLTERDTEILSLSGQKAEQADQIQSLTTQLSTIRQILQAEQ